MVTAGTIGVTEGSHALAWEGFGSTPRLQVGSRNLEMKAYTLYVSCFSALQGLGVDFGLQTCRYSMKVNVR